MWGRLIQQIELEVIHITSPVPPPNHLTGRHTFQVLEMNSGTKFSKQQK